MKKLLYVSLVFISAALNGCKDDILVEKDLKDELVDGYYTTQVKVDRALVGVYAELYTGNAINNEVMMANLASDEMFAGGEPGGDLVAKAVDGYKSVGQDMFNDVWESSYRGIYRASLIIDHIDGATYANEADKKADKAEAKFMRALYYFRLAKYFGAVPVFYTATEHSTLKDRASLEEVYALIAADLKDAISLFPATAFTPNSTEYGKANKWVAEAYLARVYLFYTGYKTNIQKVPTTTLPVYNGQALSKTDVTTILRDCKTNGGYKLESDFRNLWPYAKAAELGHYPWAVGSKWDGDGGGYEKMFVVRHGKGSWTNNNQKISNILCLYQGIRDLDSKLENVPFGPGGWGWCTVSKNAIKAAFPLSGDVRQKGSVIDFADADDMKAGYVWKGDQVTGYANKKYTQLQWKDEATGNFYEIWHHLFLAGTDMQLNDMQDLCLMRYADVLLMLSELTGSEADGLTEVRARVGLSPIAATSTAIQEERRREFTFEGLRWFDELRFGTVEADLAVVNGETIKSAGVEKTYEAALTRYKATKGLWPIPESQIKVTGNLYAQNPGW